MNRNIKIFLAVTVLTLLAFLLRFYNITKNPVSLNNDEVAFGYNAYSILKTGRDENGAFMPLFFPSVGDYKNPVPVYFIVPSIAVFGLNEFGIRFPTALAGTLSIPIFFFLLLSLLKSKRVALIGTVLLALSPWHIFYSRYVSDHILALLLLMMGMLFFQKMLKGSKIWAILSAFFLILSTYTYYSNRLFVPIFILACLIINYKRLCHERAIALTFISVCFILFLPLIYLSLTGSINARAAMVFLSQDIDYTRYVILDHLQRKGEIFMLFSFWIKRYLNYFQPDFLFFRGLNMTNSETLGLGVLYLFELPWFILGIIELLTRKIKNKAIIVSWILIGLIPASITNNEQNAGRSLLILPMIVLIVSMGVLRFFQLISKIRKNYIKFSILGACTLFIGVILIQAFLVFAVHFPRQKGEAFMEGTKETVLYAMANKEKYQEIVYDPYRGIEAPYIVNIPYMYILFFSKYNPEIFQKEKKRQGADLFGFDKYTIRRIDWRVDRSKKDTLFIGSPWSLPLKDIKPEEILKKIYLSNGDLALLIVSPKLDTQVRSY